MFNSRKFTGKDVYGIANTTPDNYYIPFLDFDNTSLDRIKVLSKQLQEMFKLSDFLIFRTGNGFHTICFSKVTLDAYLAILNYSNCCQKFRRDPLFAGHNQWVLRLTEKEGIKPKYIYTVKSKYDMLEESLAHIDVIEKFYGFKIDKTNADKNTELIGCKYPI